MNVHIFCIRTSQLMLPCICLQDFQRQWNNCTVFCFFVLKKFLGFFHLMNNFNCFFVKRPSFSSLYPCLHWNSFLAKLSCKSEIVCQGRLKRKNRNNLHKPVKCFMASVLVKKILSLSNFSLRGYLLKLLLKGTKIKLQISQVNTAKNRLVKRKLMV